MEEEVTLEELKEALDDWKDKFELISSKWPDASIEDQIKILGFLEDKAKKIKENKKLPMGFKDILQPD